MVLNFGSVEDDSMIIERKSELQKTAFRTFAAEPNPIGLTLTITDSKPGKTVNQIVLHLSKQEGLALLGNLAPAVMSAGNGSNLD